MNTISPAVIELLDRSVEIVEREFRGLVIGNEAENFSAGANLALVLEAIGRGEWELVESVVASFQAANQRIRFCRRPVVAAPRGLTLGGGCEIVMAAGTACAAAETYIGLVEVGAGLIPSAGGCKEMVRRVDEMIPCDVEMHLFPLFRRLFETVGMGRVAGSAREAMDLGFLRGSDRIVMNGDHLLKRARDVVLTLDAEGYLPPRPRTDIRVLGAPGLATFRSALHNFAEARQITEHDQVVGERLAWVLCGGDLSGPGRVSEEYLLNLERRAFIDLCRERRTQERMTHLLKTGKPLRN
jgi:3-hydroxyacyl-CoA dehydrogenase